MDASQKTSSSKSFVDQMEALNKDMIVFYGSQTGTAEDFATRFVAESPRWGFNAMLADCEDYDMEELENMGKRLPEAVVVFFMATYGEGEPTDSSIDFYTWLTEMGTSITKKTIFKNLNFCVFGLGNTSYEHYQAVSILVAKKLIDFGATQVLPLGKGDDNFHIENDYLKWKRETFPKLALKFGKDIDMSQESRYMPREIDITISSPSDNAAAYYALLQTAYTGEMGRHKSDSKFGIGEPDLKNPMCIPVTVNNELFSVNQTRSCRHIEFDLSKSVIRYSTGDHVGIYPTNNASIVNRLSEILKVNLDSIFDVHPIDAASVKKRIFPVPTTFRTCFTHYLDIQGLPKQHHLFELSQYAKNIDEKAMLELLSSEAGEEQYALLIQHESLCFVDILDKFLSLEVPVAHFLEIVPRLQCRYYSISSSSLLYPKTIHVTAVVVDFIDHKTELIKRQGVCTGYLSKCITEASTPQTTSTIQVPLFVRRSTFRMPKRVSIPMILIGPGTGLAPLRAFLQERKLYVKTPENTKSFAVSYLYYGCRNEDDHLYKEELDNYESEGIVINRVAYSRKQGAKKTYVQDLIRMDGEILWSLIDSKSAHIYVCGDAKNMAIAVHNAIKEIIIKYGSRDETTAQQYIKNLSARGRYSQDVW